MKVFILLQLFLLTSVWAIPEKDFPDTWLKEAVPYFKGLPTGTLLNSQGLNLRYYAKTSRTHLNALVIIPGRTEPAVKYAELLYDLKDLELDIFILDHQGQGESDRQLKDTEKGHVVLFDHYVRDFELFVERVAKTSKAKNFYLLAHSMGGAIGVKYMAQAPHFFTKAVLTSPMFQLNTKPYSERVARYLSFVLTLGGRGTYYAPDRGPYIPENDTFEKNELTHSEARFDAMKFLFTEYPELAIGGPTNRWVNQSLKATRKIHLLGNTIKTPILLFQAGKDLIVKPQRQEEFCSRAECQLKLFPSAQHEILMETDEIRDEALRDIRVFLGI